MHRIPQAHNVLRAKCTSKAVSLMTGHRDWRMVQDVRFQENTVPGSGVSVIAGIVTGEAAW